MQQNSATLIYDLNTLKGTWKKMAQPFKIVQLQAWQIAPSSISLNKKTAENSFAVTLNFRRT